MRAAVPREHGEPLDVTEVSDPEPDPEGVLVEVEACGVCRSDWHGWRGDWGWLGLETRPGPILGHEPAGRVVAVGADVEGVAVHGCGGVGLSAVHVADALGENVVAVDIDEEKLERAGPERRRGGERPGEVKAAAVGGRHVSVDALGIAETCRNSVRSLATRGTHVQVGLTTDAEGGEVSLPTDRVVMKELEVAGSLGNPPTSYDELLRMVAAGSLDPGAVVSGEIGLEDITDRLRRMTDYDTVGIPVVTEF